MSRCNCDMQALMARGCPSTKGKKCPNQELKLPAYMEDESTQPSGLNPFKKKADKGLKLKSIRVSQVTPATDDDFLDFWVEHPAMD